MVFRGDHFRSFFSKFALNQDTTLGCTSRADNTKLSSFYEPQPRDMSDPWTTLSVLSVFMSLSLCCFKSDTIRTLRASVHGDTRKKMYQKNEFCSCSCSKMIEKYEAEEKNRFTPHIYEHNYWFSCLVFSFLFRLAFPFPLLFFFPCCNKGLYVIL